ncbi:MAG: peptidoglycan-associated lipoprotein Pal [Alphaproteobacteria bacterium]|nr:peptidoglycan-associated lipoprotein Pal [Alphaproteobacteria bacterium]MBL6954547.1 peptidoglycan-associated lipoprotein Pal [Alphaproteobacteria bacterium]
MVFEKFALKAACLAATILLVAACGTPAEEKADASGTGGAKQSTSMMTKAEPKAMMKSKVIPGSQEDLVLNIGGQIQFDFDKSNLRTDSRRVVERWADWMRQYPAVTVTIEGHCDERGTREYNLGLGERRADSARKYLIALGINADRVGTISYGKERPLCVSSNEECWSQNRRDMLLVN